MRRRIAHLIVHANVSWEMKTLMVAFLASPERGDFPQMRSIIKLFYLVTLVLNSFTLQNSNVP